VRKNNFSNSFGNDQECLFFQGSVCYRPGTIAEVIFAHCLSRLPTGVFFRRMPLVGKRPMFSFAPEHWWGKPLVEPARSFDQLEEASVEES